MDIMYILIHIIMPHTDYTIHIHIINIIDGNRHTHRRTNTYFM